MVKKFQLTLATITKEVYSLWAYHDHETINFFYLEIFKTNIAIERQWNMGITY